MLPSATRLELMKEFNVPLIERCHCAVVHLLLPVKCSPPDQRVTRNKKQERRRREERLTTTRLVHA